MAVDRTNTIQILYSTADTAPASVSGLNLGKGELAWVDHNGTPGDGGENGRLYIGDGTTAAAVPRWIGGIGTGVAAAAASALTGTSLASGVVSTSITSLGTQGEALDMGNYAIENVGDIDADSVSVADAAVGLNIDFSGANTGLSALTIKDNVAEALVIQQGTNDYMQIVTTDSSEALKLGHGVSGTAITIGHSTSETTVADNLTVAGDLAVSGTPPTWNQNTTGTSGGLTGSPAITVGAVTASNGTFSGDVAITGDLTVSGGTTELSSTVIAATDKELLLSVTTGIMTAGVTRSGTTLTITMESAHGLSDNGATGYEVPITGSANQTALPDGVYKVVYSSSTELTATSPVSGAIASSFAASVGLGVVTDTTATGAGIVVPRTVALGNASLTYEGASAGWSPTGNFTFEDGAFDVNIASHDTSNGLKLGGTLVTATATELNYVDGVTSAIQTQLDAKGTSSLAIGTSGGTAMEGNVLSAQDKTDIGNLSGVNTGDQTLTGLGYVVNDADDEMAGILTINNTESTTAGVTDVLILKSQSSGTPAAGIGTGISFGIETAAANVETGARIEAVTTDVSDTNEDIDLVFYTMLSGDAATEALRVHDDGNLTVAGDINMAAKNIVMTPSTDDTITFTPSANGALTITTVDTAGHAADVAWVIDGSMSWAAHSGMDLSAAGVIENATLAGGTF